tara:strand:+ start:54 stop:605 length:552 start_codon:yes stop_codon:yes gene_type:complete
MKKLLFLLMMPVLCFGQGDFRKMNFGQSVEDLKTAYPEEQFFKTNSGGFDVQTHSGNLAGIEVQIMYAFQDNKLYSGIYMFKNIGKDTQLNLNDYITISNILKKKYTIKNEDEWFDTKWKDKPDYLDLALLQKHVNLKESAQNGNKLIVHTLTQNENLGLAHSLVYAPADWVEKKRQESYDDF